MAKQSRKKAVPTNGVDSWRSKVPRQSPRSVGTVESAEPRSNSQSENLDVEVTTSLPLGSVRTYMIKRISDRGSLFLWTYNFCLIHRRQ